MSEEEKVTVSRTFRLKVTTKVQQLCAANPKRRFLFVQNLGDAAVYILSAQNLTTSDGIKVAATTGTYTNDDSTNEYWIVADSDTQDVRVEVVSD